VQKSDAPIDEILVAPMQTRTGVLFGKELGELAEELHGHMLLVGPVGGDHFIRLYQKRLGKTPK
jgi:hypothetical protein